MGDTQEELDAFGPTFADNFREVVTLDVDPAAKPQILWDLTKFPWPVPVDHFDQVHAYEVLEHLTFQGDYEGFFRLWRQIWDVTKLGGLVCASTPWWESQWVWQDPGHRMCYAPGLLTYLNQDHYTNQIGVTTMTDYRRFWSPPYSFRYEWGTMTGNDPKVGGFKFALRKVNGT